MKRALLPPLLGLAAIVGLSSALGAFGDSGHRIIGRVAELHLERSRALTEVRKILRPQETLAEASVWPDTIKNSLYEDGDTPLFRLAHPAQDTYHYTNIPFQAAKYDPSLPGARPTDILQMTRECIRVLRGTSKTFTPREALRMLAHLVGDMHQPVHDGNSFISASGPLRFVVPEGPTGWRTTAGGNALVYGPQDRFNLHSYWDTHVVNLAMRNDDVPTYATRLVSEVPVAADWTDQRRSRRVARTLGERRARLREGGAPGHPAHCLPGPGRSRARAASLADRATRRVRRALASASPHPAGQGGISVGRDSEEHLARPVKV